MQKFDKCVYCGVAYSEELFHKGQIACKECKKKQRKNKAGKKLIRQIVSEKRCSCGSSRVFLLTTTNLLNLSIEQIKGLSAICLDCLLDHNLK